MPSFTQIEQNPNEELEKVGFLVFVKKLSRRKWAWPLQSDSAPFRESRNRVEWATYGVGVIGKNVLAYVIAHPASGSM